MSLAAGGFVSDTLVTNGSAPSEGRFLDFAGNSSTPFAISICFPDCKVPTISILVSDICLLNTAFFGGKVGCVLVTDSTVLDSAVSLLEDPCIMPFSIESGTIVTSTVAELSESVDGLHETFYSCLDVSRVENAKLIQVFVVECGIAVAAAWLRGPRTDSYERMR